MNESEIPSQITAVRWPPFIALLSDFGIEDWFVGAMRGEILSLAPGARIIDLTHAVPPQNIVAGAFALSASLPSLPAGTVVCAVVDPGVGTNRRALCGWIGQFGWSGPDNGLATPLLALAGEDFKLFNIENLPWRKKNVSSTFHGRDLFAPAAALLANEGDPAQAGPPVMNPVRLGSVLPKHIAPNQWQGCVQWIDHFGNCLTNFEKASFGSRLEQYSFRIQLGNLSVSRLALAFGVAAAEEPLAYWGSTGYLEIGINKGSAASQFGIQWGIPAHLELLDIRD